MKSFDSVSLSSTVTSSVASGSEAESENRSFHTGLRFLRIVVDLAFWSFFFPSLKCTKGSLVPFLPLENMPPPSLAMRFLARMSTMSSSLASSPGAESVLSLAMRPSSAIGHSMALEASGL